MIKNYKLRNYNFKLLILVIITALFGTLVINSADSSYLKKQIIGLVFCICAMVFVSLIDYQFICKFWIVFYFMNILMLIALRLFGKDIKGAKRWFPIGDFATIQPSEFTKILLIICLAVFLAKYKDKLNTWSVLAFLAISCAIPLFLVLKQPDLSTTLDIAMILVCMIFVAGLSYKIIGVSLLIFIPIFSVFIWYVQTPNQKLLEPHQLDRVLSFLYPQDYLLTTGYQQYNSIMAIGSGMLNGKGINTSMIATVKDANLISEQQTDFIFSVIGEELGFIGCVFVVAILCLIVLQCIKIARKASDTEGMLIATGVASLFALQTFFNIGVATGILPNTGLPLPLISYGLSSLLSSCVGIGLVLNIGLHKRKY